MSGLHWAVANNAHRLPEEFAIGGSELGQLVCGKAISVASVAGILHSVAA